MKSLILPCALLLFPVLFACGASEPDGSSERSGNDSPADAGSKASVVSGPTVTDGGAAAADAAADSSSAGADPTGRRWRFCSAVPMRELPAGGRVLTLQYGADAGVQEMTTVENATVDTPVIKGTYLPASRSWFASIYSPNGGPYGNENWDYGGGGAITFSVDGTRFNGTLLEGLYDDHNVYGALEDGMFRCDPPVE